MDNANDMAALADSWAAHVIGDKPPARFIVITNGADQHIPALLKRGASYVVSLKKDFDGKEVAIKAQNGAQLPVVLTNGKQFGYLMESQKIPIEYLDQIEALYWPLDFSESAATEEEFFNWAHEFVDNYVRGKQLIITSIIDSGWWMKNTATNYKTLKDCADVGELKDSRKGQTAVVCGSGPSLDGAMPAIAAAREHISVFCGNSAYGALIDGGITPDFVVSADPRDSTYNGIRNHKDCGCKVLVSFSVCPMAVGHFAGRENRKDIYTWATANSLLRFLRASEGKQPGTYLYETGTVVIPMTAAAILMGFSTIFFCGQDLAYTESGDYGHSKYGLAKKDVSTMRRVKGNVIDTVPTDETLYNYKLLLEGMIAKNPEVKFYNTSRIGAKIEGAEYREVK